MPRGMGRGRGAVEKPKDFGGVMKKLVKFCSRYIPVMILALVLGAAGTVCQIIGPDKLKDMTNEITKGLPARRWPSSARPAPARPRWSTC